MRDVDSQLKVRDFCSDYTECKKIIVSHGNSILNIYKSIERYDSRGQSLVLQRSVLTKAYATINLFVFKVSHSS